MLDYYCNASILYLHSSISYVVSFLLILVENNHRKLYLNDFKSALVHMYIDP